MTLTTKAARGLLKDVQFPGDNDPTYLIAVSGKQKRRELLLLGNEQNRIAAAVELQRIWRGYRTRCKLQAILGLKQTSSATTPGDTKASRFPHVTSRYHEYIQWCDSQGIDPQSAAIISFEDYCARIVQSWWRRIARLRGGGGPFEAGNKPRVLDEQTAATLIQTAWRRYNDMKVYWFYRSLISFRGRGDPSLMLKSINPAEAKLIDKATGVHVRFRLGGEKFPPNIYYKVFTRRPIVDLCACSPRDYTNMSQRKRLPKELHNRDPRIVKEDRENWYKRWENNGWRLVSDRIFLSSLQDPITTATASMTQEFHHSKLQRREDVKRKRKHRKIEWLRKMHREGMLQARQDLGEMTVSAVNVAADNLVEVTDTHGSDIVEEGDVDELLRWTNGLNFDEYLTDWYLSASSAFTDGSCQVVPSDGDPYEITLKAAER